MKKLFSMMLGALISFSMINVGLSQVTVTPGPATNYSTLKAAFDAINAGTHGAGAIAVSINANTTEVDSASLNAGVFTSCTVMPTATVSVTMTTNHPAIYLNGADNVTIDGRIGGTGTTRSLTINNYVAIPSAPVTTNNLACVSFSNGATSNVLRYTNCRGAANAAFGTTTAAGSRLILITLSLPGTGGNNNNIVEFNDIQGGARGIQCFGTAGNVAPYTTFYSNDGNIIRNNIVRNSRAISIFCGSYVNGLTVDQNEILTDSTLTFTAAAGIVGLQIQSAGTVNITRNWIHDFHTSTTQLANQYRGMIALPVWFPGSGFTPVTNVNMINNMVSIFSNNPSATFSVGMQTQFSSTANIPAPNAPANYNANIYNNSVRIGGTATLATQLTEGLLGNVAVPTTGQVYTQSVYNNIVINDRTGGASAFHIGLDIDSNAVLTTNADNNFCFASDPLRGFAANYGSFAYTNFGLEAYKSATCENIPKIEQRTAFKNVNFVSSANLHIGGPVGGDMNAVPSGLVTTDFDGTARNANYPYRGCDEGSALKVLDLGGVLEGKVQDGEVNVVLRDNGCVTKSTSVGYLDVNTNSAKITFGDSISNGTQYHIDVQSINHMETYSATMQSFSGGALAFSFTTSQSQAFGSNLTASAPHAFYGGDANGDSTIDLSDIVLIFNEAGAFASGCRLVTDINSDEFVDLSDLVITFNNSSLFISLASPCPAPRPAEGTTRDEIRRNPVERFDRSLINRSIENN